MAVERIAAAAEAARSLEFPFFLTARAHTFLYADPSLADTMTRLQIEKAGADVLFAPGLPDLRAIRGSLFCDIATVQFYGGGQRKVISHR